MADDIVAVKKKRMRSKDYSKEELSMLISSFVEHNEILNNKHSNDVTQRKKKDAMSAIVGRINAVGGNDRSAESIKDKWQNLKSNVKKKAADFFTKLRRAQNQTGGGELQIDTNIEDVLTMSELEIYRIIPVESVQGMFIIM